MYVFFAWNDSLMSGHYFHPLHSISIRSVTWFWALMNFKLMIFCITVCLGFVCACVSSLIHTKTHRYNWPVRISVKHERVTTTVIIVVAGFRDGVNIVNDTVTVTVAQLRQKNACFHYKTDMHAWTPTKPWTRGGAPTFSNSPLPNSSYLSRGSMPSRVH